MGTDLGVENLLGIDGTGQLSSDLRESLALATRYIANWYKATKDSDNKDVWWQKIDTERAKVEAAYNLLLQADQNPFPGNTGIAAYSDAASGWPQLWRDLSLSPDTIDTSLLNSAADFFTTVAEAPGLIIPQIGNELGKIVGGTLGNFLAQTWPYIALVGAAGVIYVFRGPLGRMVK